MTIKQQKHLRIQAWCDASACALHCTLNYTKPIGKISIKQRIRDRNIETRRTMEQRSGK